MGLTRLLQRTTDRSFLSAPFGALRSTQYQSLGGNVKLLMSIFTPLRERYARWWVGIYLSWLDWDEITLVEIELMVRRLALFPEAAIRGAFARLRQEAPFYNALHLVISFLAIGEPRAATQLIPEMDAWMTAGFSDAPDEFIAEMLSLVCFVTNSREKKGAFLLRLLTAMPQFGQLVAPLLAHYTRPGDPWIEQIELQTKTGTPQTRRHASKVFALMSIPAPEAYDTLADQAVNASDQLVRYNTVQALGRFDTPEALGVITTCLQGDPDLLVRIGAAIALRKKETNLATLVPPLLQLLPKGERDEINWVLRFTASFGLAAFAVLFDTLRGDLPNQVKAYAISLISHIAEVQDSTAGEEVEQLLTAELTTLLHCLDWATRPVAIVIYGLVTRVDCFETVLRLVRSGSSPGTSNRCADLFLCLLSENYRLLDRLVDLTIDDNADLRTGALFSILDLPDLRVTAAAHRAFEDADMRMKCMAAYRFLFDKGIGENAVQMLLEYTRSEDPLVQKWAIALMQRAYF
jgi:HEAT repeat protein